jgi:hypothetical protein
MGEEEEEEEEVSAGNNKRINHIPNMNNSE